MKKDECGQAIVIIFILITLALGIGVGIASRFVRNIRSSRQVDLASRAVAIAEAGVEKVLLEPYDALDNYIQYGSCGAVCQLTITGEDGVIANSQVTLSYLGSSADPYRVDLSEDNVQEINLSGYPASKNIWVCWNATGADAPSVVAAYYHGTPSSYGVDYFSYNSPGSSHTDNGFDTATGFFDYLGCFDFSSKADSLILRLKSIYAEVNVYVLPDVGEMIPSQGILISAEGTVEDVTRVVKVLKSKPFLPAQFDYALYSRSSTEPLSN